VKFINNPGYTKINTTTTFSADLPYTLSEIGEVLAMAHAEGQLNMAVRNSLKCY